MSVFWLVHQGFFGAALGFQLALFLYALLVPLPSRHFWQVGESSFF